MASMFPYCRFCMKVLLGHLPEYLSVQQILVGKLPRGPLVLDWEGGFASPAQRFWCLHKNLGKSREKRFQKPWKEQQLTLSHLHEMPQVPTFLWSWSFRAGIVGAGNPHLNYGWEEENLRAICSLGWFGCVGFEAARFCSHLGISALQGITTHSPWLSGEQQVLECSFATILM